MNERVSENIKIMNETLDTILKGFYIIDDVVVRLKLSKGDIKKGIAYSEKYVHNLIAKPISHEHFFDGKCEFYIENKDLFEAAVDVVNSEDLKTAKENKKILILSFVNPIYPGGGVLLGKDGLEEYMCRRSTFLISLLGDEARKMYSHNREIASFSASDCMTLFPNVEIIKDSSHNFLDETVVVSVLAASAPVGRMQGVEKEKSKERIFNRLFGMLRIAAENKYEYIILGLWEPIVSGDEKIISNIFRMAFDDIFDDFPVGVSPFRKVVFAVLDQSAEKHSLNCFKESFEYLLND